MIQAGKDHHATEPPVPLDNDTANAGRWPILSAWKSIVRDPEKERTFTELYDSDKTKAIEVEDVVDLAYRCAIPAAMDRAIQQTAAEEDDIC